MWRCPLCQQTFVRNNQTHSCNEKALNDFLDGKTAHTVALFWHFIDRFRSVGPVTIHPTKSMIAIAGNTRVCYITQLGKTFMDVSFPFTQPYNDNLCFHKIAQVPGTTQYNHHFRMQLPEDVNEEVLDFMRIALEKVSID